MLAAALAPFYLFAVAEAVAAFGAMACNAVLAQAAPFAGRLGTGATFRTVFRVIINTLRAQLVFFAATVKAICVFATDDQTYLAFLAGHLYAIYAMLPPNPARTLLSRVVAKMLSAVKAMAPKAMSTR